jgi:hypothetical protein
MVWARLSLGLMRLEVIMNRVQPVACQINMSMPLVMLSRQPGTEKGPLP